MANNKETKELAFVVVKVWSKLVLYSTPSVTKSWATLHLLGSKRIWLKLHFPRCCEHPQELIYLPYHYHKNDAKRIKRNTQDELSITCASGNDGSHVNMNPKIICANYINAKAKATNVFWGVHFIIICVAMAKETSQAYL